MLLNHELYDTCIDCNSCMKGCPMLEEFTDSPKSLLQDFKTIVPNENISFSCTTCDYCYSVCPSDISFKEIFKDSKQKHAQDDKTLNSYGYKSVLFHQKNSFSKLFTSKTIFKKGEFTNMAFMPGCALSSYSPSLIEKTYKHLFKVLPGINVLQQCCGQPTRIIGDMKRFDQLYTKLQNDINMMKVDTVVTACENCYMSLKEYSPNIKVVSLYEVLDEYGIPEEKKEFYKNFESLALHDPCPTRYEKPLHDSVRNLLKTLGISFEEFKRNKEKTECCGSGGMLEFTNPTLAIDQMKNRVNQTKCDTILSYCQSCAQSMSKGGKNGIHILDLIFNETSQTNFTQKQNGTISRWLNRYKSKRNIDKLKG